MDNFHKLTIKLNNGEEVSTDSLEIEVYNGTIIQIGFCPELDVYVSPPSGKHMKVVPTSKPVFHEIRSKRRDDGFDDGFYEHTTYFMTCDRFSAIEEKKP